MINALFFHESTVVKDHLGESIRCFNKELEPFLSKPLEKKDAEILFQMLEDTLSIPVNQNGVIPAALRDGIDGADGTNYDAVWVRDCLWIALAWIDSGSQIHVARRVVLALWDYYALDEQIHRFEKIIDSPELANDKMAVPHIRFNGSNPRFPDVYTKGKPQLWTHKQNDAHGLFLFVLGKLIEENVVTKEDFSESRIKVLNLFPQFFEAISYETYEDAGAWEEIDKVCCSSISAVVRGLLQLSALAKKDQNKKFLFNYQNVSSLIENGLNRVRELLVLGGESPLHKKDDLRYREADMALLYLVLPEPLPGLNKEEVEKVFDLLNQLKREYGYIRYVNDSYQSANYWFNQDLPVDPSDDASDMEIFLERERLMIPNSEAQWFFDSMVSVAYYKASLSMNAKEYREFAELNLKRALGQLTGLKSMTAEGKKVSALLCPESINTIMDESGNCFYHPSPIVPLNWAKSSLYWALFYLQNSSDN